MQEQLPGQQTAMRHRRFLNTGLHIASPGQTLPETNGRLQVDRCALPWPPMLLNTVFILRPQSLSLPFRHLGILQNDCLLPTPTADHLSALARHGQTFPEVTVRNSCRARPRLHHQISEKAKMNIAHFRTESVLLYRGLLVNDRYRKL